MKRRDFVKLFGLSLATPAILTGRGTKFATAETTENAPVDENLVVIFSDTHVHPESYQQEALAKRIETLLAMNPRPGHLLIYGDFAFDAGMPEDYAVLREMMKPVEAAGIPWDLAFGNHDRREAFFDAFPERVQKTPNVPGKFVSIVSTPKADFILLDSLLVGKVEGAVDEEQTAWLAKTLENYPKPVFVGAHHPLIETKLDALLRSRPAVAGYIHGHNHVWKHSVVDGLPELGIPSTGHWGDIGFVTLNLTDTEALFRLQMIDFYKMRPKPEPDPEWIQTIQKKKESAFFVPLPSVSTPNA